MQFFGYEFTVEKKQYQNGDAALVLLCDDGSPLTTASVCLADHPFFKLKEGDVAIKNYSENEGVLDVLVDEGVVSAPHTLVNIGFVDVPVCKLLI